MSLYLKGVVFPSFSYALSLVQLGVIIGYEVRSWGQNLGSGILRLVNMPVR